MIEQRSAAKIKRRREDRRAAEKWRVIEQRSAAKIKRRMRLRAADQRRRAADPEKFRERGRVRYAADPEKFRERGRVAAAAKHALVLELRRLGFDVTAKTATASLRVWHAYLDERTQALMEPDMSKTPKIATAADLTEGSASLPPPRDEAERIMRLYPDLDIVAWQRLLWESVRQNEQFLRELVFDWSARRFGVLRRERDGLSPQEQAKKKAAANAVFKKIGAVLERARSLSILELTFHGRNIRELLGSELLQCADDIDQHGTELQGNAAGLRRIVARAGVDQRIGTLSDAQIEMAYRDQAN